MLAYEIILELYYEVKKSKQTVWIICCHLYKEKNEHTVVNLFIYTKALGGYTRKVSAVVSWEGNQKSGEQKGQEDCSLHGLLCILS